MKQLIIAVCAMAFELTAHAQTNAPVAAPPTVTPTIDQAVELPHTEPVSATRSDNGPYLKDPNLLIGCQAELDAFANKPCDLIFIGDSITAGWRGVGSAIWAKYYEPRHALNFGISGDKTQNVLWRLNNMDLSNLKPKVAVILIGGNNIGNTPHEIADGIKAVLANTQEAFPGVKIILVSVMPNERATDKMMQVNSLIRGYADDSTVYYLDLVPLMPPITTTAPDGTADTNWKGLGQDRLHPDATGYQIWADAMDPLLTKLLAGQ